MKKRFACGFLFLTILLSFMSVSVHASNHSDTYFYEVNVPRSTYSSPIPYREKENSTPVYLNIIDVDYSMVGVHVQALGVTTPSGDASITYTNLTYSNGQLVENVSCYEGTDYLISSLIYERGYRLASLRFITGMGHSITLWEGKWSPDSIGEYEPAE